LKIQEFLSEVGPNKPSFVEFPLHDVNPLGRTEKTRWISAPNQEMRIVHGRFIKYLRRLKIDLSSATGARKTCSPVRNAERHRYHHFFYLTDIHGAYDSVDGRELARILFELGDAMNDPRFRLADTAEAIHTFLREYCLTEQGGLLTGAPASPDLFNIYCGIRIDPALRLLCEKYGITYTRYLDDLTFSSDQPIGKRKRRILNQAIRFAGFVLSDKKTKVFDLAQKTIEINGIGLELGGRIFLPRRYARKLRGFLHAAMPMPDAHASKLNGMMSVFHCIYRRVGTRVRSERQLGTLHEKFKVRVRRARGRR